jgi:hypothetical protein
MGKHLRIIADHHWPIPGTRAFREVKAGAEGYFLEIHARALLAAGAAIVIGKADGRKGGESGEAGAQAEAPGGDPGAGEDEGPAGA